MIRSALRMIRRLISVVIVFPIFALAADDSVVLSGTISTENDTVGAQLVTLKNTRDGIAWTFLSSGKGLFRLEDAPPGPYEVSIHYQGQIYEVANVGFVGRDRHLTINLDDSDGDGRFVQTLRTNAELLDRSPQDDQGFDLLKYHCVQCHGLEFIVESQRSSEAWSSTVQRMAARVPEAPEGEMEAIDRYLSRHFNEQSQPIKNHGYREYVFEPDAAMVQLDLPDPSAQPHEIEMGPAGRLWIGDFSVTNQPGEKSIFLLDPETLAIEQVSLPISKRGGVRSITFDETGAAWFVMLFDNSLLRLKSLDSAPEEFSVSPTSWPHSVAIDNKGKVWVTGMRSDSIGRFDPETGDHEDFKTPTGNTALYGLATDAADNLWYSGLFMHKIGKFDPSTSHFTEYTPDVPLSSPRYLKVADDGKVWVALFAAGELAQFDPTTAQFKHYSLSHTHSAPYDLTFADNGNVWYTDFNRDSVGQLDPETGKIKEYSIPLDGHVQPTEVALDDRGRIWLCENGAARVTFIDPGAVTTPGVYVHGNLASSR